MAGIISLADQVAGHGLGQINPALYEMGDGAGSGINDVTLGNNGVMWTDSHGVRTRWRATTQDRAMTWRAASGRLGPRSSSPSCGAVVVTL